MAEHAYDVIVIGSGAAGLTAALNLAPRFRVAVLAKGGLSEGSTAWAQGGIAAVLEPGDTFESHVEDTMIAGAGLNNRAAVEFVVGSAPAAIARLADLGVPFNVAEDRNSWHLTREGGHSHRRIVHVADATGYAVQQALETAAGKHPNITLVPDMVAIDLVTGRHASQFSTRGAVHGLYAYNRKKRRVETLTAKATILATGGAGRAYLYSTAPRGATGDGIAMAWRAGCRVSNMEMMQFHPTCLYSLQVKNFLITEAVRGEGALLLDGNGERFVEELAPRDEVALAVHRVREAGGVVHLDMRSVDPALFPNVVAALKRAGIDPRRDLVPVAPAAHYTMGGIATGLGGEASLLGLLAVGECACNGLHGANRLASNSLAECFVFGRRAAIAAADLPAPPGDPGTPPERGPDPVPPRSTRAALWRCAGLVRDPAKLERLVAEDPFPLARAIARAALAREESRGAHQRLDFPETDPELDLAHAVVRGDGTDPVLEKWR
jgi:L-aspartate oxidase